MQDKPKTWSGNLDAFVAKCSELLRAHELSQSEILSVRLVRDYMSRGILGEPSKSGRELVFEYPHVVRLVAARILLADGWSLAKIREHFDLSTADEIEALLPGGRNRALEALSVLRAEVQPSAPVQASATVFMRAAQTSSMQLEMRDALKRLGLPQDGPATEEITLIAIAPWFQALVGTDHLRRMTLDEAEEIGRAVSASIATLIMKKGSKK